MDEIGRKNLKDFDLLMERDDFSNQEQSLIYDSERICPCCNKRCCCKGCSLSLTVTIISCLIFYVATMNDVFKSTLCFDLED